MSGTFKEDDSPTVNYFMPSTPRMPPFISSIHWTSHFSVGGWKT